MEKHIDTNPTQNITSLFPQIPLAICIFSGTNYLIDFASELYVALIGKRENIIGTPFFDSFPSPDSTIESFLCLWSLSSVVCDSYTRCTCQKISTYCSKTKFSIILSCTCLGAIIFGNWIKLITSLKVSNCDNLEVCNTLIRSLNAKVVTLLEHRLLC